MNAGYRCLAVNGLMLIQQGGSMDVQGKMFLVKDFQVKYEPMDNLTDPTAPTTHLVTLSVLSEVGGHENLMRSPLMFLSPADAKRLGQLLIREAKAAADSSSRTGTRKRH